MIQPLEFVTIKLISGRSKTVIKLDTELLQPLLSVTLNATVKFLTP